MVFILTARAFFRNALSLVIKIKACFLATSPINTSFHPLTLPEFPFKIRQESLMPSIHI